VKRPTDRSGGPFEGLAAGTYLAEKSRPSNAPVSVGFETGKLFDDPVLMFSIAFFGLPLAASLLVRDGHDVVLAALSREGAPGQRRLRRLVGEDRVCVRPDAGDPRLVDRVRRAAPDLVVSWFWTKRLPVELIACARLGGINAHPSLLPRHRGPDPTYWAIATGDEVTGVTVHRLAEAYDTGPILAQEEVRIDPGWNALALARALDRPALRLLRATVARIARGETLVEREQDEQNATEAPAIADEDAGIRWSWSTARVLRHVRALAPAPGAFTELAGAAVTVLAATDASPPPVELSPGEAVAWKGRVLVGTADGAVALIATEVEGRPTTSGELALLIERAASRTPSA
jgi:methionyl-tRNA formyltransferase